MIMRVLLIGMSLLSAVLFSAPATASELQPLMESIGQQFKATFRNASRANNSEEARATVTALKENIEKSVSILPDGVSPNDEVTVERYQGLMNQLLEKAVLLEDAFATNPMNRGATIAILKEMDELRKKGHAIFR